MSKEKKSPLLKNTLSLHLFSIFSVISLVSIFILNMLTRGQLLNDMLFGSDYFMDFFNSVCDSSTRDVYTATGVIYPPLANLYFYIVSRMIPADMAASSFGEERAAMYSDGASQMQFLLFFLFAVAVLAIICYTVLKRSYSSTVSLEASLFLTFSFPIIYCVQRGNITLLAMVFSMVFCFFRNSENKAVRELSFVALAIAAGLKLYPALFGVLLIFDKKYKEAVRLVLYGIFFFVAPLAFYGGLGTLKDLFRNIFSFAGEKTSKTGFYGTSISNVTLWFYFLSDSEMSTFTNILKPIIYAGSVFTLIFSKEEWKKLLSIFFIFANIASVARVYILIFLLIPFISFVMTKSTKKITLVYGLIFCALIIAIPSYIYFNLDTVAQLLSKFSIGAPAADMLKSVNKLTCSLFVLLFEILLFGDTIIALKKRIAEKKSAAVEK